jgi:hypothetical protein
MFRGGNRDPPGGNILDSYSILVEHLEPEDGESVPFT